MLSCAPRHMNLLRGTKVMVIGLVTTASVTACTLGSPASGPLGAAAAPQSAVQNSVPNTSSAEFENFTVTISRIDEDAERPRLLVQAEVCVTSIPASYVGKRIRISWDPWSVTAGKHTAEPGFRGKAPAGLFRADGDYKVGGCVSGLIPFEVTGNVDSVRYQNSVGDEAVWDAASLTVRTPK
jgi:hypothetical protein